MIAGVSKSTRARHSPARGLHGRESKLERLERTFGNTFRGLYTSHICIGRVFKKILATFIIAIIILLKVIALRLLVNHIEQRLCREPTCLRRAHSLVGVTSLGVADFDRLLAS